MTDAAELRSIYAAALAESNRRRWLADPSLWVTERLHEVLWSKQRAVLESVRDNRLTAVHSAHATGKSFLASRLACWWIDVHPPGEAFVVSTATTWKQVEVVLWRELRRAHAKGGLPGRTNRTEWLMPVPGTTTGAEEQVAFGHRPAESDPTAFHGVHAPYVLVIFDEAGGLPRILWEAALSLISNENSRFLAIGNPIDPVSEFAKVCKPGSGWNPIHISAFHTPVYTGEPIPDFVKDQLISKVAVEEAKVRYGEKNPLYIAKVLGEFPDYNDDGLIPAKWVRLAQERWDTVNKSHPVQMGVDVGAGGDKNVVVCRWGMKAQVVLDDREPDTMKTAGRIKRLISEYNPELVKVDYIGIGRGAVDRLKEQKLPIQGIEVGRSANDIGFRNLRAWGYWQLRELFRPDKPDTEPLLAIDPDDEELAAQLLALRYEPTSDGKIQIESKESMKRRNVASPDRADALMLAFLPPGKRKKGATWGRRSGESAVNSLRPHSIHT